jgi:hypothetical protein
MSVIREQLLCPLTTAVLPSERAHRLNPSRRRYQLKRYRQARKDTFDDTGGTAEAEHRRHTLARHGVDLFDKGFSIAIYMWAERISQHVCINLIDDTRPALDFKSRHVDDDKFSAILIQNSYCSERSDVASKYPHLASFNLWEKVFLLP